MAKLKTPKKLIEVALPLDDINQASAHEKSVRQGHPSSLHLYWARRPLAAARAVLFAQLVNDPGGERGWSPGNSKANAEKERERLFEIIRDLSKWENIGNKSLLERANEEILRAWNETKIINNENSSYFDSFPSIHDPFSGGGAIPLEAQRLGLKAIASDINPVALIINHAMINFTTHFVGLEPIGPILEYDKQKKISISASGLQGVCEDIRRYGDVVKQKAFSQIGQYFPKVEIEGTNKSQHVISWIWARTVESPNPAAKGMHVPMVKSFILSKKTGKSAWIEYLIDESSLDYTFEVKTGASLPKDIEGTVGRKGAKCILTGSLIPLSYIRQQGKDKKIKYRLMAIAAEGNRGRLYLSPNEEIESIAKNIVVEDYPSAEIEHWPGCTNCVVYGYERFEELFTNRQLLSLVTFSNAIIEVRNSIIEDAIKAGMSKDNTPAINGGKGAVAYADLLCTYLSFALDKMADLGNSFCAWEPIAQCPRHLFGKQAIPMVWDFAEANPFSNSSGSWSTFINGIVKGIPKLASSVLSDAIPGKVYQAAAQAQNAIQNLVIISTDPPYYDNVPYSNLSDFFYIWLRRSLRNVYRELFSTITVPKMPELVANQFRHGGKEIAEKFFLDGMKQAMHNMARDCHPAYPVTIYYAFKASETRGANTSSSGWETFLEAIVQAGFIITGTWPLRTENASRMRGQGANALASSILLVCRKREEKLGEISRRQFQRELRESLPIALVSMIGGTVGVSPITPVDLAQSAIGPGMAIFSKYDAILNQDGSRMGVHDALILINRVIAQYLSPESGSFDADTQFCSIWCEQYGWSTGPFGEADILARAKGTTVEGVRDAGVLESGGGRVYLLKWAQYASEWDPTKDKRTPIWEACHHMIRRLNNQGESAAGELLAKMPEKGESIRQLAYHLYTLCDRKNWVEEARAYNELIGSWNSIATASHEVGRRGSQTELRLNS